MHFNLYMINKLDCLCMTCKISSIDCSFFLFNHKSILQGNYKFHSILSLEVKYKKCILNKWYIHHTYQDNVSMNNLSYSILFCNCNFQICLIKTQIRLNILNMIMHYYMIYMKLNIYHI